MKEFFKPTIGKIVTAFIPAIFFYVMLWFGSFSNNLADSLNSVLSILMFVLLIPAVAGSDFSLIQIIILPLWWYLIVCIAWRLPKWKIFPGLITHKVFLKIVPAVVLLIFTSWYAYAVGKVGFVERGIPFSYIRYDCDSYVPSSLLFSLSSCRVKDIDYGYLLINAFIMYGISALLIHGILSTIRKIHTIHAASPSTN